MQFRKEKRIPIRLNMRLVATTDQGERINSQVTLVNASKSGVCFKATPPLPIKAGDRVAGSLHSPQMQTEFVLNVAWADDGAVGGWFEAPPAKWFVR